MAKYLKICMITSQQLGSCRSSSDDYALTEQLKAQFLQLRKERQPFYLNKAEFDKILHWKLRGQYERQRKNHLSNTEEVICCITGTALTISHSNLDYELELRVRILCTLRGVGVPVASAVLALVFPEKYAVIDFRGWRQIFSEEKKGTFSTVDYQKYLKEIYHLAEELKWLPQEVDLAIWEYDRLNGSPSI